MFDLNKLNSEILELEKKSSDQNLWKDNNSAKNFLKQLKSKKDSLDQFNKLDNSSTEILELCDLSLELEDESSEKSIHKAIIDLREIYIKTSLKLKMKGEFDQRNAILGIKQGAGGVDSQDWAEILLRMYKRWSEINNFTMEIMHISQGDEAGIKSAIIRVEGE